MQTIKTIDAAFIEKNTNFSRLIDALKNAFSDATIEVPMRHHHDFPNPKEDKESTLLLMPAWNPGRELGVKIVTVSPNNGKYDMPSIQGTYLYLDAHKGDIKAIMDAKALTAKRTAAASALAARFLAKKDACSLLMIGTGALASNLIQAHASARPIKKVYIWGRTAAKADAICKELSGHDFTIERVDAITDVIEQVDIISCATLSKDPLVFGKYLKPGQHVDLVGAYKKDMRETDNDTITKGRVFIDTYQGGLKESGDIVIPLQQGILKPEDIQADLFELCSAKKQGRISQEEITVFKSVGHAIEDLAAATYYHTLYENA